MLLGSMKEATTKTVNLSISEDVAMVMLRYFICLHLIIFFFIDKVDVLFPFFFSRFLYSDQININTVILGVEAMVTAESLILPELQVSWSS